MSVIRKPTDRTFFQARTSLNEKTLRSRYLEITRRCNKIAHDADLIDVAHVLDDAGG